MLAMKKLLAITLLALITANAQASLRCENGIADRGDRTSEVLAKCGAPASQAVTGYILDKHGNEKFQKEEWVYGPRNGGMLYFLQFEGERLVRIDSKRSN
jgi:hypothetical protein